MLLAVQDKERPPCGFPTGGTPHTVDVAVFAFGQVIVDDVLNVGDVESS